MRNTNKKNAPHSSKQKENQGDNIDNQQFEEKMFSTLDDVCRSSEQTYDDFMAGFSYLKPEHVKRSNVESDDFGPPPEFLEHQRKMLQRKDSKGENSTVCVGHLALCERSDEINVQDIPSGSISNVECTYEPDALEEQVLGEGTKTQDYLMRPDAITKNVKVKIGNFVEEEDNDSDTPELYFPSFSTEKKSNITHGLEQNKSQVSDVKNTVPQGQGNIISNPIKEQITLNENVIPKPTDHKSHQSLQTTTQDDGMKTDQSDSLLDLLEVCDTESESSDMEYDPSLDRLNFGEIDEEDKTSNTESSNKEVNVVQLDFKTVAKIPSDLTNLSENSHTEDDVLSPGQENKCKEQLVDDPDTPIIDEVEPFALDENFDYDNVTLTPKFSAEEMAIIMNTVRLGPVYPVTPNEDNSEE